MRYALFLASLLLACDPSIGPVGMPYTRRDMSLPVETIDASYPVPTCAQDQQFYWAADCTLRCPPKYTGSLGWGVLVCSRDYGKLFYFASFQPAGTYGRAHDYSVTCPLGVADRVYRVTLKQPQPQEPLYADLTCDFPPNYAQTSGHTPYYVPDIEIADLPRAIE